MKLIICTDRTCPSPFNYNFNFNFMPPIASAARVVAKAPRKSIFATASVNGTGNGNSLTLCLVGKFGEEFGKEKGKICVKLDDNGRRSILATTTTSPPTPTTSNGTATTELGMPSSGAASSALEQLDFERGVCVPFHKYSPEMVRNRVLESRGAIFARGIEIVWNLGFYWSTLIFDFLVGRDEEVVPYRARQLRNLLCDLGPSFIKAGQDAFNIIEEELGQPLEAVFSKISSETIAVASLGQVYRATLRASGEDVAIKVVQRPEIEPIIYRDLFLFRNLASLLNGISLQKLGCNAELIVDEFGEKLLEELDYTLEARNIEDFLENFKNDPTVKLPRVYKQLCGLRVLVMEWIDGIRCTDPQAIKDVGIDVNGFLTIGVSVALRQLLEFGFFHGDPHPGNIFAMRDGRIAYVDFGNVAVLKFKSLRLLERYLVSCVFCCLKWYQSMGSPSSMTQDNGEHTTPIDVDCRVEDIWDALEGHWLEVYELRNQICNLLAKLGLVVNQWQLAIDNVCIEGLARG
ncbi:unnamed protein product [Camellia sinensis]